MKAGWCIRVSEIITTSHGVQQLIIMTETCFGTIAKVQSDAGNLNLAQCPVTNNI